MINRITYKLRQILLLRWLYFKQSNVHPLVRARLCEIYRMPRRLRIYGCE